MKRSLQSLLAIALILGLGLPAWRVFLAGAPPPPAAPPTDLGPVPVESRAVEARDLELEVVLYGTLEPRQRLALAAELSGRLARVHAGWDTGARVAAGAELFALDEAPFELAVGRAEASLAEAEAASEAAAVRLASAERDVRSAEERLVLAERERDRIAGLQSEGIVSPSDVDRAAGSALDARVTLERAQAARSAAVQDELTAGARIGVAQAALAEAGDRLARTTVRAPIDGRFVARAPTLGRFVAPGEPLGELVDTDVLVLVAAVPEDELALLEVGQAVDVQLVGRAEVRRPEPFAATVSAIAPVVDGGLRSGRVEIEVPNDGREGRRTLAAGLFAEATVHVAVLPAAVYLARSELQWRSGQPVAFVLVEAAGGVHAERRELGLARPFGEGFVVDRGLAAGERLITAPLDPLDNGVPCRRRDLPAGAEEEHPR
ncbi:MAG: efflux RND transporter periplasmic adaptor subunit [Planctomycetota bacterium]